MSLPISTFEEATAYARANGSKPPVEEVTVVGGVVRRSYRIKAGSILLSEVHPYDHLSILLSGEAILKSDGKATPLVAPYMLEIKAGIEHALYAVTDLEWDCLHALSLATPSNLEGLN